MYQNIPNNQAGYLARRGEILASLGPIDEAILSAIIHNRKGQRVKLTARRSELEAELIRWDDLNQRGFFSK